jgi:hypothetical protein
MKGEVMEESNRDTTTATGDAGVHGMITEGLLKKGGINTTAPTPKPAPPPGQSVRPAPQTGPQSGSNR